MQEQPKQTRHLLVTQVKTTNVSRESKAIMATTSTTVQIATTYRLNMP